MCEESFIMLHCYFPLAYPFNSAKMFMNWRMWTSAL